MQIHLDPEIFELVKNGTKNVEARVNDEKRRQIKVGDKIEVFKRPDEQEVLLVRVTGLKYFSNFSELAYSYPIERLYSPDYTVEGYLSLFPQFYAEEEIAAYGVVAIEFELINSDELSANNDDIESYQESVETSQAQDNALQPNRTKSVRAIKIIGISLLAVVVVVLIALPIIIGVFNRTKDNLLAKRDEGKYNTVGTISLRSDAGFTSSDSVNMIVISHEVYDSDLYLLIRQNGTCPEEVHFVKYDLSANKTAWHKNVSKTNGCSSSIRERDSIKIIDGKLHVGNSTYGNVRDSEVIVFNKNGDIESRYSKSSGWMRKDLLKRSSDGRYTLDFMAQSVTVTDTENNHNIMPDESAGTPQEAMWSDNDNYIIYYKACTRHDMMGYCNGGYSMVRREYKLPETLVSEKRIEGAGLIYIDDIFRYNSSDYGYYLDSETDNVNIIKIDW